MNTTTKKPSAKSIEREEATTRLRAILHPGDTVYGIVRTVSRSGMSRTIDFYRFDGNERVYLSGWMATALDYRRTDRGALKVGGCGMDMIFATVYNLGRTLFPSGFAVHGSVYRGLCEAEPCTCHDDSAWSEQRGEDGRVIRRTYPNGCSCGCKWSMRGRNGDTSGWDDDGGYALKSESL